MPRSRAIRRASGLALMRPPFDAAAAGADSRRLGARGLGRGGAAFLAVGLAGGRLGGLLGALRARPVGDRDLLALLADHRDGLADGNLALLHGDLQQHAARLGLDLLRDLVGVELVERLALLDAVALAP